MVDQRKVKVDAGLQAAIRAAGSAYRLAQMLGVTPAAVQKWRAVPYTRVTQIEELTGVPRERLRPELYRSARPKQR